MQPDIARQTDRQTERARQLEARGPEARQPEARQLDSQTGRDTGRCVCIRDRERVGGQVERVGSRRALM